MQLDLRISWELRPCQGPNTQSLLESMSLTTIFLQPSWQGILGLRLFCLHNCPDFPCSSPSPRCVSPNPPEAKALGRGPARSRPATPAPYSPCQNLRPKIEAQPEYVVCLNSESWAQTKPSGSKSQTLPLSWGCPRTLLPTGRRLL